MVEQVEAVSMSEVVSVTSFELDVAVPWVAAVGTDGRHETVAQASKGSDVVIEATCGWYCARSLEGPRLCRPSGQSSWQRVGHRRVKNHERDPRGLADPVVWS